MVDVGKTWSIYPSHGFSGIWIRVFFVTFKSRPEPWIFTQNHRNPRRVSPLFSNFLKPKFQPPKFSPSITPTIIPPKNHQKFTPKDIGKCFFAAKKKSLNFWGFLSTSGRRRGGHVQSTNAGLCWGMGRETIAATKLAGCFLTWWVFPLISHPKMVIFRRKTHGFVGETHQFRKPRAVVNKKSLRNCMVTPRNLYE